MDQFPDKENLTNFLQDHIEKKGNYSQIRVGNRKVRVTNGSEILEIEIEDMDELMTNPDTDFLVLFYSPESKNYLNLILSLEKLGNEFRELQSDIQIYKLNAKVHGQEELLINQSHSIWFVNKKEKKPTEIRFEYPFDPNFLAKRIEKKSSENLTFAEITFSPIEDDSQLAEEEYQSKEKNHDDPKIELEDILNQKNFYEKEENKKDSEGDLEEGEKKEL